MQEIRTTGDLRGFLGEILLGLRDGTVERETAAAISKIASNINQSLSVEVNATIQLKQLGEGHPVAGSMRLTQSASEEAAALPKPSVAPAPAPATHSDLEGKILRETRVYLDGSKNAADKQQRKGNISALVSHFGGKLIGAESTLSEAQRGMALSCIRELILGEMPACIAGPVSKLAAADQDGLIWCDQCDMRVSPEDAIGCKAKHCKAVKE